MRRVIGKVDSHIAAVFLGDLIVESTRGAGGLIHSVSQVFFTLFLPDPMFSLFGFSFLTKRPRVVRQIMRGTGDCIVIDQAISLVSLHTSGCTCCLPLARPSLHPNFLPLVDGLARGGSQPDDDDAFPVKK